MAALVSLLCVVLSLLTGAWGQTRVKVTTPLGEVIGTEETHLFPNGNRSDPVRIFRGIPYAEAPVGKLRFRKPRKAANFSRPFEAFHFGPACPQRRALGNMSEDCLFLNIYVPKPSSQNTSFPVMVWIHGGAFVSGEGRVLPAETLAAYGNIIAVTFNFRLGALGFLTTYDKEASGNWGLWDQRLALQWVKENVVHFHGDPENITLAGTTSGAFCVTYHALHAPQVELFHRIIVESGTATSTLGYHLSGLKYAEALAEELGCIISKSHPRSSEKIIACLREKDPQSIVSANVKADSPFRLVWIPVVDREFITEDPSTILSWPGSGKVPESLGSVEALVGTTSSDGSIFFSIWVQAMASAMNESVDSGVSLRLFEKVVEAFVKSLDNSEDAWMITQAVRQEYTRWYLTANRSQTRGRAVVDLFTDKGFFIPSVVFTRNHALSRKRTHPYLPSTYMYQFHQGSPAPDPYPWMTGSLHKDHDLYVFGMPQDLLLGSSVDLDTQEGACQWRFSERVMTYWSNFAKTGNPNTPEPVPEEWPPFTLANEDYLHLQACRIAARRHYRPRETSFWLNFVPQLRTFLDKQRQNCPGNKNFSSGGHRVFPALDVCSTVIAVVLLLMSFPL
ncbi:hypothetical protein ACOMHN_001797 [Nucella lapillus]